jgi:hypothetical protein
MAVGSSCDIGAPTVGRNPENPDCHTTEAHGRYSEGDANGTLAPRDADVTSLAGEVSAGKGQGAVGRPRKEVDLQLLGLLAEAGASIGEVAAMLTRSGLDIDARTIKRRLKEPQYHDAWQNGVAVGKVKLRLQMVKQSRLMNSAGVQMAIHLSKHWLGMTEKTALDVGNPIVVNITPEDAKL